MKYKVYCVPKYPGYHKKRENDLTLVSVVVFDRDGRQSLKLMIKYHN